MVSIIKLYENGDRCPCCGHILKDKSPGFLKEFSTIVAELGLPPWPEIQKSWDAYTMLEETSYGKDT